MAYNSLTGKTRRLEGFKLGVDTALPTPGKNRIPRRINPEERSFKKPTENFWGRMPGSSSGALKSLGSTEATKPVENTWSRLPDTPAQTMSAREAFLNSSNELPKAPKSWTQDKMIGEMNVGDFVSMAGQMGYALAPDTPMGRVGAVAAGMAGQEQQRVADAPGKALDRRSKMLEIAQAEKDLRAKGKLSDYERWQQDPEGFEKFKSAGKTGKFDKYQTQIKAFKENNPDASDWDAMVGIAELGDETTDGFDASQMSAIKYIQERIEAGADLDEVNYIANQAGVGQFELAPTGEMKHIEGTGFMGFGKEYEPVMKITPVKNGKKIEKPETKSNMKKITASDGQRLLFNTDDGKYYDIDGNEVKVKLPEEKKKEPKKTKKPKTPRKKVEIDTSLSKRVSRPFPGQEKTKLERDLWEGKNKPKSMKDIFKQALPKIRGFN